MQDTEAPLYSIAAPTSHEKQRLEQLYRLEILDTSPEPRFDRLTSLVADVLDVPIALISLVDENRQWFKSSCGLAATETPRDQAFCAHALHCDEALIVEDALQDERFRLNPMVTGEPNIRFYAGAVLRSPEGQPLGTLCLIDTKPRSLSAKEKRQLLAIAKLVQAEMNQDITDAQSRVRSQLSAHLDPMTGFFNYAEFCNRCEAISDFSGDDHSDVLLFVSLPQLDFIYRVHGLETSQSVVGPVAQILVRRFQSEEVIFGRQLREGLLVFVKNTNESLDEVAASVGDALNAQFSMPSAIPDISIRIGIAKVTSSIDRTTYHCKAAASSGTQEKGIFYRVFSDEDLSAESRATDIAMKLLHALEADQLALHYQPKVSVRSGQVTGAEALLRWRDDRLGTIPPSEIVSAAISADLVSALDTWVLKSALKDIAKWKRLGLGLVPISVNFGSESFGQSQLPSRISDLLQHYDVEPNLLHIEVLESAVFNDLDSILPVMEAIHEMGVRFALDDFGTEYSSLRYLQKLPISVVKIDRSFVQGIVASQEDAALAMGIISISHDLGMDVVAEGIEDRQQYVILKSFQCDSIQGHLFSSPLSGDEFQKCLDTDFRFELPNLVS